VLVTNKFASRIATDLDNMRQETRDAAESLINVLSKDSQL
jgi:hypothetical protein